jgi:hypothetical protein
VIGSWVLVGPELSFLAFGLLELFPPSRTIETSMERRLRWFSSGSQLFTDSKSVGYLFIKSSHQIIARSLQNKTLNHNRSRLGLLARRRLERLLKVGNDVVDVLRPD